VRFAGRRICRWCVKCCGRSPVRVELLQNSSGAGKLIVEFAGPKASDAVIEAFKAAVEG
jgi:hypothetical protein